MLVPKTKEERVKSLEIVITQMAGSVDKDGIIQNLVYPEKGNDHLRALIIYGWVKEVKRKTGHVDFRWVGPRGDWRRSALRQLEITLRQERRKRDREYDRDRRPKPLKVS